MNIQINLKLNRKKCNYCVEMHEKIFYKILLLLVLASKSKINGNYTKYCEVAVNVVTCENFSEFHEINLHALIFKQKTSSINQLSFMPKSTMLTLVIFPKTPLKLDNNFNSIRISSEIIIKIDTIIFYKIKSIEINSNIFSRFHYLDEIKFRDSIISFTNQQDQLINQNDYGLIFNNLRLHMLAFENVYFLNGMPPQIFQNSHIFGLKFDSCNVNNAFKIFLNKIKDEENLLIKIDTIIIYNSRDKFNSKKFSEAIIMQTKTLDFDNTYIEYIDRDFLNSFKHLKHIYYWNCLNLTQANNLKWIKNINSKKYLNLNESSISETYRNDIVYLHLKEDFNFLDDNNLLYLCKFKYFPFHQLVIPHIWYNTINFTTKAPRCTCTFYWLFQYANKYGSFYRKLLRTHSECLIDIDKRKLNCDFKQLFENCSFIEEEPSVFMGYNDSFSLFIKDISNNHRYGNNTDDDSNIFVNKTLSISMFILITIFFTSSAFILIHIVLQS